MGFAIVELFTTWLWRLVSNSRSKPTSSFIFISSSRSCVEEYQLYHHHHFL